jgi:hypothetical protein
MLTMTWNAQAPECIAQPLIGAPIASRGRAERVAAAADIDRRTARRPTRLGPIVTSVRHRMYKKRAGTNTGSFLLWLVIA